MNGIKCRLFSRLFDVIIDNSKGEPNLISITTTFNYQTNKKVFRIVIETDGKQTTHEIEEM